MPLIEGVGDEVVQFVGVVFVLVVGALAWFSTNARPDRYRTVLVMRSRPHHPVTVSIRTRPNLMASNTLASSSTQSTVDTPIASTSDVMEETRENARVIPLQEMDSIVDADMAMLDNNRLHFYRRIDSPTSPQNSTEPPSEESEPPAEADGASTAQIREMDSIVSAMEADVASSCRCYSPESNPPSSTSANKDNQEESKSQDVGTVSTAEDSTNDTSESTSGEGTRKILIKLKYLNDTLKEVEGSLDELLKDFKWRHFSVELSAQCRVRLIFRGRALLDDAATLRACGLHHRAVVHCLVHPKRAHSQRGGVGAMGDMGAASGAGALGGAGGEEGALGATHELLAEGAPPERAWDLENILMTLVSVALTVVWFFRCEYSNMFTASASVALFGLTVFYSVAIFGLYLSDSFHLERRNNAPQQPTQQQQPVPNH